MLTRKSTLARIMAKENITLVQSDLDTASFDIQSRILYLPNWEEMDNDIYDMFVGHEIGHALWTPEDYVYQASNFPPSLLNVIEDVRIEQMVLGRFPGLNPVFKRAYVKLWNKGFFGEIPSMDDLRFMDRLNVHAKMRGHVNVPFSSDEKELMQKAYDCRTFDDVLGVCGDVLVDWIKKEGDAKKHWKLVEILENQISDEEIADKIEKNTTHIKIQYQEDEENAQGNEIPVSSFHNEKSKSHTYEEVMSEDKEESDTSDESLLDLLNLIGEQFEAPLQTVDANDKFIEASTNKTDRIVMTPDLAYVKTNIVPFETNYAERSYALKNHPSIKEKMKESLGKYRREAAEIVREFERKKTAKRFLRAKTSRKGSLDVRKLHSYKYSDDLFQQMSVFEDDKNHGMVMLVDNSSSMAGSIRDVYTKTLILCLFCEKMNIPFRVYQFTSGGGVERPNDYPLSYVSLYGTKLVEVANSDVSVKDSIENVYLRSVNVRVQGDYMSGTPLSNAIHAMVPIINHMRSIHGIEKMSFVTLTDGDGFGANIYSQKPATLGSDSYICFPDGSKYKTDRYVSEQSLRLIALNYLRENGVTIVDFFVGRDSELKRRSAMYSKRSGMTNKEYRSKGVATIDTYPGYDRAFLLLIKGRDDKGDPLDMLDADATNAQRAKALSASMAGKNSGRIIANKFAEIIG